MKALRFERFGSVREVLRLEDVPDPKPGAGEIVVRIAAASINPSDTKNILGKMEGTTLPRTPGRDFAGTVISGPAALQGREVFGSGGEIGFTRDGAHAGQIVVPAEGVAIKPARISMAEAASVGTNFVTAYAGLIHAAKVKSGEWVVVTGARGGVGSSVIQLAKWKGARVIAVDRGAADAAFIRQYGIDLMLNTGADDISTRVKEATGGRGADIAYDCVGGPLFEICLETLGQLGRQVNITSVGERRVSFDLLDFYHRRLTLYGIDSRALDTRDCARILSELAPAFESGTLRAPRIAQITPLEGFAEAYEAVETGKARGKVVFVS
jgi:NADPH2:quinone reductase